MWILCMYNIKNQVEIFFLIMQTHPAEILYSLQAKEGNILSLWGSVQQGSKLCYSFECRKGKRGDISLPTFITTYSMNTEDYLDGKMRRNGLNLSSKAYSVFSNSKVLINTADMGFEVHIELAYLAAGHFIIPGLNSSECSCLIFYT